MTSIRVESGGSWLTLELPKEVRLDEAARLALGIMLQCLVGVLAATKGNPSPEAVEAVRTFSEVMREALAKDPATPYTDAVRSSLAACRLHFDHMAIGNLQLAVAARANSS